MNQFLQFVSAWDAETEETKLLSDWLSDLFSRNVSIASNWELDYHITRTNRFNQPLKPENVQQADRADSLKSNLIFDRS